MEAPTLLSGSKKAIEIQLEKDTGQTIEVGDQIECIDGKAQVPEMSPYIRFLIDGNNPGQNFASVELDATHILITYEVAARPYGIVVTNNSGVFSQGTVTQLSSAAFNSLTIANLVKLGTIVVGEATTYKALYMGLNSASSKVEGIVITITNDDDIAVSASQTIFNFSTTQAVPQLFTLSDDLAGNYTVFAAARKTSQTYGNAIIVAINSSDVITPDAGGPVGIMDAATNFSKWAMVALSTTSIFCLYYYTDTIKAKIITISGTTITAPNEASSLTVETFTPSSINDLAKISATKVAAYIPITGVGAGNIYLFTVDGTTITKTDSESFDNVVSVETSSQLVHIPTTNKCLFHTNIASISSGGKIVNYMIDFADDVINVISSSVLATFRFLTGDYTRNNIFWVSATSYTFYNTGSIQTVHIHNDKIKESGCFLVGIAKSISGNNVNVVTYGKIEGLSATSSANPYNFSNLTTGKQYNFDYYNGITQKDIMYSFRQGVALSQTSLLMNRIRL